MLFLDFTLKSVTIPYYEVKGIPILMTLVIILVALFALILFLPYEPKVDSTPPSWAHLFWSSITFLFLVIIVFWMLYLQLRKFWWWVIQKKLDQDQYILINEYNNIDKKEVIKKILQNFPDIENQPENVDLALMLYKNKYLLYQKFWGVK